ncbi:hypothetical protein TNCV_4355671 [Trichonephila clavipes]|nr:hypothetical protein TNCV_4355671 [Trichonephila clavipes]
MRCFFFRNQNKHLATGHLAKDSPRQDKLNRGETEDQKEFREREGFALLFLRILGCTTGATGPDIPRPPPSDLPLSPTSETWKRTRIQIFASRWFVRGRGTTSQWNSWLEYRGFEPLKTGLIERGTLHFKFVEVQCPPVGVVGSKGGASSGVILVTLHRGSK